MLKNLKNRRAQTKNSFASSLPQQEDLDRIAKGLAHPIN
jgi:hypothetical protein